MTLNMSSEWQILYKVSNLHIKLIIDNNRKFTIQYSRSISRTSLNTEENLQQNEACKKGLRFENILRFETNQTGMNVVKIS